MEFARPLPGWTPSTPTLTGGQIEELARKYPAVAVHFWAPWNGVDRLMDDSIQAVSNRFDERIFFASCNVDLPENSDICRRCRFANIAAVSVIKGDCVCDPIIGYRAPDQLVNEIEKRLVKPKPNKPWWAFWRR